MDCFMTTIFPWPVGYAPYGFNYCDGTIMNASQYQAVLALIGSTYGGDGRTTFGIPNLVGRYPIGAGRYSDPSGSNTYSPGDKGGLLLNKIPSAAMPLHTHSASFTGTAGPQTINIPAQKASGTITATATTDVVPGQTATQDPIAGETYYMTGVSPGNGPFIKSTVSPAPPTPTNKATLIGTNVVVDPSQYNAATPAVSATISVLTGGNVAVGTAGQGATFSTATPYLALNFIFALSGLWPQRNN